MGSARKCHSSHNNYINYVLYSFLSCLLSFYIFFPMYASVINSCDFFLIHTCACVHQCQKFAIFCACFTLLPNNGCIYLNYMAKWRMPTGVRLTLHLFNDSKEKTKFKQDRQTICFKCNYEPTPNFFLSQPCTKVQ